MEHLPRKRKSSQTSPVQEHRCIPQEDPPAERSIPPPPSADMPDDASVHRPKRPRLSLDAPASLSPARRSPPPRRRDMLPRPPAQPQPSSHYLLHRRPPDHSTVTTGSLLSPPVSPAAVSPVPTDTPHKFVPPALPIITRDTLHELDLESILKNPQLRHDLLFDPGLQFRPTPSRRKQLASERYWIAIARELEYRCTCTAWDATGVLVPCGCQTRWRTPSPTSHHDVTKLQPKRRRPPTPPPWCWSDPYKRYKSYYDTETDVESVPRVLSMLHELIAVLKSVIVPPSLPTSHAPTTSPQPLLPPQSASDAEHLLSHFDPPFIHQELLYGKFDPSGLFTLVGETLKRHCAPMRDRQVDAMINTANGTSGTALERTLSTMRMCFEILELMKLDIANHQLQYLRPFFAGSTPSFELQVFLARCRIRETSLQNVRVWLQNAWDNVHRTSSFMAGPNSTKRLTELTTPLPTPTLSRRTKVYMALIDGIIDLVFNPLPLPLRISKGYPETLYLDAARVTLLVSDAADLTALYMLLMLWRQLVFWSPASGENDSHNADVFPPYGRDTSRLEDWEVDRMKREIWEIGPRRIGRCFLFSEGKDSVDDTEERAKWTNGMQNAALQIAMRAEEARTRTSTEGASTASASPTTRKPPSQPALDLMSGWIHSHMRRDSGLACRLRELLKREVTQVVSRLMLVTNSNHETVPGPVDMKAPSPNEAAASVPESGGGTAGLEPLMPEIRHLAQRLAKLVLVNMQVYWSLYEAAGFLVERADVTTA